MPSVESVKKDLEALGTTGQEEILAYLEEVNGYCILSVCFIFKLI